MTDDPEFELWFKKLVLSQGHWVEPLRYWLYLAWGREDA